MRAFLRFLVSHLFASFCLQLLLVAWALAAGEIVNPMRAVMAMLFAPILVLVPIFRLGPMMRPLGYGIYCLMYLTLLAAAFFLLTRRARQLRQRHQLSEQESAAISE